MNDKQWQARLFQWLKDEEAHGPRVSVLCAYLDAHELFEEASGPAESLRRLFAVLWPKLSLDDILEDLMRAGLLASSPGGLYAIPHARREELAATLGKHLLGQPLPLARGAAPFRVLLDGLLASYSGDLQAAPVGTRPNAWGGEAFVAAGHNHLLLRRPTPLRLQAYPGAFVILVTDLSEAWIAAAALEFAGNPALRKGLALVDVEWEWKVNLTRSEVAVYFERYLRREHGLRIAQAPVFTQAIVDAGILSLRQG